jgi:hypothetical protein
MDQYDKEFENFLKQFRLRQPGSLPTNTLLKRRSMVRWFIAAAAALILIVGLSSLFVRKSTDGAAPYATVAEAGSPSLYMAGERIEAGRLIRSNSAVGLLLDLNDGSRIEVRSQSELQLESAADGIRVRLNEGSVLVTAAKQGSGHLYVQTRDAMVSVVGTVFLVHAEQAGTRVAVVEGEVHVQQGAEVKKVLRGEQTATNAALRLTTVAEEISWSRRATEYAALLPQNPTPDPAVQNGEIPDVKDNVLPTPETIRVSSGVLPYTVEANYFKLTSDSIRTLITIQIMTKDLAFRPENGAQVANAHVTGVFYRSDNRRMSGSSFSQDINVSFPSEKALKAGADRPNLYQVTTYLAPGKYKLPPGRRRQEFAEYRAHYCFFRRTSSALMSYCPVPQIPDQGLQASSMLLAYSVTTLPPNAAGTEMFALSGVKVKPNPSGVFRAEESLNCLAGILRTDCRFLPQCLSQI